MNSSLNLNIKPIRITYEKEILEKWRQGDRLDCKDPYIISMKKGTKGFGEYLAGKYFESMGYNWIHHDFNIFGGNKKGKYPKAEEVILKYLGTEKYDILRKLYPSFREIQEPDLLIYNDDCSEIMFAECKRLDTKDKLNEKQINGLVLLNILLQAKVFVCEIAEVNINKDIKIINHQFK